jgi:hypothetical protein
MNTKQNLVGRLRDRRYTGPNRCTPCTVLNIAIAVVLSGFVTLYSFLVAPVALAVFLLVIYFRGYLVPYTPTLTQEYLPDGVRKSFKRVDERTPDTTDAAFEGTDDPTPATYDGMTDETDETDDFEELLIDIGVADERPPEDDVRLKPSFEDRWNEEIDGLRNSASKRVASTAAIFDVNEGDVSFEEWTGDEDMAPGFAIKIADRDGTGIWHSRAAFIADVAAVRLMTDLDTDDRTDADGYWELAKSLRMFLERCPVCDGQTVFEERESGCCGAPVAVSLVCTECDALIVTAEATATPG